MKLTTGKGHKTILTTTVLFLLLSVNARADVTTIASENFDNYPAGYKLTVDDDWSSTTDGKQNPDAAKVTVTNKAMEVQNLSNDGLRVYWQEIPTLKKIVFSYDIIVYDTEGVQERSDIGQFETSGYISRFLQQGPNTGVYLQYHDEGEWKETKSLGSFEYGKPYHVVLQVEGVNSTVRMRYGAVDGKTGDWSEACHFDGSTIIPFLFMINGKVQFDNISISGDDSQKQVTFPSFDMTAGDIHLTGHPKEPKMIFTLQNNEKKEIDVTLELHAPRGHVFLDPPGNVSLYRDSVGQKINSAGPGSWMTHKAKVTVPANDSKNVKFTIDCPNWNPYNRYPLTCRLVAGDQTSTQVRDIAGKKSEGVFLGQPRDTRAIKTSHLGTMFFPYNMNMNPEAIPFIAKAGLKWVRTGAPTFHGELEINPETDELICDFTELPLETVEYLETMNKYDLKMIWVTGPTGRNTEYMLQNPEKCKAFWTKIAKLLAPYGVNHFEICNEPTSDAVRMWGGSWNGVPPSPWISKLAHFMNVVAEALKEGNPNATAIAGAGCTTAAYRLMEAGLSENVDGITDHPYPYGTLPELIPFGGPEINARDGFVAADDDHSYRSFIRRHHEYANKIGRPDFQFWFTEAGFSAYQSNNKTPMSVKYLQEMHFNVIEMGQKAISSYEGYTERTQAKYNARRLVETLAFPEVTVNFIFCFQSNWMNPRHWEANWFLVKDDLTFRPEYYVTQRICGLFSDGVMPIRDNVHIETGIDIKLGRSGSFWTRPYVPQPVMWNGTVPLYEPTTPRSYVFSTPENEVMLALWMPIHANEEIQPEYSDVVINTTGYEHPIAIDLLDGKRYDLEFDEDKEKDVTILRDVTVPDYPVVIKMFPKNENQKPVFTKMKVQEEADNLVPSSTKKVIENFDNYKIGQALTGADHWMAHLGGNETLNPDECRLVKYDNDNIALELSNNNDGNLRARWMRRPADLDPDIKLARISYDMKLIEKFTKGQQRAWLETATGGTRFWFCFSNSGTDTGIFMNIFNANQRGYNNVLLGNSFELDKWYHVEVDMDYVNNKIRARFNKPGEPSTKWSEWFSVGALLDRNEGFVFGANDIVQYDNIELAAIEKDLTK